MIFGSSTFDKWLWTFATDKAGLLWEGAERNRGGFAGVLARGLTLLLSTTHAPIRAPTYTRMQIPVLGAFHAADPHLVPAEVITDSQYHSKGWSCCSEASLPIQAVKQMFKVPPSMYQQWVWNRKKCQIRSKTALGWCVVPLMDLPATDVWLMGSCSTAGGGGAQGHCGEETKTSSLSPSKLQQGEERCQCPIWTHKVQCHLRTNPKLNRQVRQRKMGKQRYKGTHGLARGHAARRSEGWGLNQGLPACPGPVVCPLDLPAARLHNSSS